MTNVNIPTKIKRGMKNAFYFSAFGAFMSVTAMLSGLNKDFNRFSVSTMKFNLSKETVSESNRQVDDLHLAAVKGSFTDAKAIALHQ